MSELPQSGGPSVANLLPTKAIVLFEGIVKNRMSVLASVHQIETRFPGQEDQRPVLGAGVPLDLRTLELFSKKLLGQKTGAVRQMLPETLLFLDESRMVWFAPAVRRTIWFRTGKKSFDQAMNGKEVLWPALLFVAERGSMKVFALAKNERPRPADPVYLAPIYNIYSHGSMCVGNVRLPDSLSVSDIPQWEKALYETEFTHSNYQSTVFLNHKRGHEGLWRQMRWRQAWRGFPVDCLVPARQIRYGQKDKTGAPLTVGEIIAAQ